MQFLSLVIRGQVVKKMFPLFLFVLIMLFQCLARVSGTFMADKISNTSAPLRMGIITIKCLFSSIEMTYMTEMYISVT